VAAVYTNSGGVSEPGCVLITCWLPVQRKWSTQLRVHIYQWPEWAESETLDGGSVRVRAGEVLVKAGRDHENTS
jgi:hypothetical protein